LEEPIASIRGKKMQSNKLALTRQQDFADFLLGILSNPEYGDTFLQNVQLPPGPMVIS
jgi:hypothetical protein